MIADRYRLLRHLEEGGMSWVWLARHMALDALVAIKIAKPDGFAGHTTSHVPEACIAAGLRHPAIVTVLDAGYTCWNDAFVVMEYLEGSSLAEVLSRDGRITPQAAVGLMLPILGALSCCHERGILHGDIKPGNVFLARERGQTRAKLLDFGVARAMSTKVSGLTGTPGYMAPEQVQEAVTDQRTDIWAACAVLYEAIAGRPAIEGPNCAALLDATTAGEITPLCDGDGRESSLWPILARGLRTERMDRFPSAEALAVELVRWLDAHGAGAEEQRVRPRRVIQWYPEFAAMPRLRLVQNDTRRAHARSWHANRYSEAKLAELDRRAAAAPHSRLSGG